jgi:carboxymethylenebutenolidase
MDGLTRLAGSAAAGAALVPLLRNDYARAATVAPDDPRLVSTTATAPGPSGPIKGTLVHPKAGTKWPAVIVVHENRGLNPHIEDVARRVALEGFLAFAPDLLSTLGGTPADEDKARDMFRQLTPAQAVGELVAVTRFLAADERSTGAVGAVGFCWGGGMVDRLVIANTDLKAAVAYYGPEPALDQIHSVKAAVMLHYAGLDKGITSKGGALAEALKKAGAPEVEMFVYDGVNHAFNNDTGPRYDKAAADRAWGRTVAFLKKYLDTDPAG